MLTAKYFNFHFTTFGDKTVISPTKKLILNKLYIQ
jgi:hypothetical protein